MKFSITTISALLLSTAISFTAADSYSDAMEAWCSGLSVSNPSESDMVVAGGNTQVTVNLEESARHPKTITGLDLYRVDEGGNPKYLQNVWSGKYELKSSASITGSVPSNIEAGFCYYRVWVTNMIDGKHGPDCLKTSHTFRVTSGSHTNADGNLEYFQHPNDSAYYKQDHYNGCFGLNVAYPKEGQTVKVNDHILIQANRDSASQTQYITKVDLYEGERWIDRVWEGKEHLQNSFIIKDHIAAKGLNPDTDYHYKLYVTSEHSEELCTFTSNSFNIEI